MKAVFVHDHRFYTVPSGAVYSPGKLSYRAWARYLKEFDELVVVGRSGLATEEQAAGLNLSSGDRVSFVFVPNLAGAASWFRHRAGVIAVLRREIAKADAVVARTSLLGEMAASLAREMGKPCAVEVVGCPWDSYWNYGGPVGKLVAPIVWWKTRRWLAKAEFAIYVTNEFLQRRYPCPGFCAHASNVEIRPVDPGVLAGKMARWLAVPPGVADPLRVGLIGSISHRYKGLHVALEAMRSLAGRGLNVHLHVLGEGGMDKWRRAADRLGLGNALHLHGSLPGGEPVMQWLDTLDLYIQPSLQEGLPRALIEAMSRGLPALGSSCGGIPELLQAECLHRPGDWRTLAEQWARMMRDPVWRGQQAERNFREARKYYPDQVGAQRDAFWSRFAAVAQKPIRMVP